jgi:hypothetical protein
MLVYIIAALVVFVIFRFFASRYVAPPGQIDAVTIVAVIVICGAAVARWLLFGQAPTAPVTAAPAWPAAAAVPAAAASAATAAVVPTVTPNAGSAPAIPSDGSALGAIDAISVNRDVPAPTPGNAFAAGSTVYVSGWAASSAKVPLRTLVLVIDRHVLVDGTAQYASPRPDVAQAYAAPRMATTGFLAVPIRTSRLAKGAHTLQVGGSASGRRHYALVPLVTTFTLQ